MRPPGVEHLADPPVPGAPASQWWPPQALDPSWIAGHAGTFDVLHVHFGTEALSPAQLLEAAQAAARAGVPLVYTVHDIEHPHLAGRGAFLPQLEALAREATARITLTRGAADELERRFGVAATVLGHPQMAPDAWFAEADRRRAARAGEGPVLGLHLRALRANVRPGAWLVPLARAASDAGGLLRVFVNDEPLSADAERAWGEVRAALEAEPAAEIIVRPRPGDEALYAELAALDLAVLPYRHGSHSGWLELCWDLGVSVAAPEVGFLREQHRDRWFLAPVLAAATVEEVVAHADRAIPPAAEERLAERRGQSENARRQLLEIYRAAVERAGGHGSGAPGPSA